MRLLIVEDEQRMAAALARGLRADGFAVEVTHD
ncbi:MAG: response regulator transcription factor, partial [Stackebrandtia sp.]